MEMFLTNQAYQQKERQKIGGQLAAWLLFFFLLYSFTLLVENKLPEVKLTMIPW